ncbi:hypothetical protein EW146_g4274 [Bondarzewia mesenterica]|uniref:Phorbol-ester/DAG-type domain-containing protein n=1 Tax=Bondarzewia mesenterica TaxID=1095465 RepID=A0A4S4LWW4_9AGAM|nr:hypothetical protein EW146_g4274 [Bondarzewia mesenterica]
MAFSNLSLRIDTRRVHDNSFDVSKPPLDQQPTGRPRALSQTALPSLRLSSTPSREKPPPSPSYVAAVFASQTTNRARDESQKLLAHLLGQLRNRPTPPSIFDVATRLDSGRVGRGTALVKGVAALTGNNRLRVAGMSTVTHSDSDSEDDLDVDFTTDATCDLMDQLKDVLSISLTQRWHIFYESASMRRSSGRHNTNSRLSTSPFRRRRRSQSSGFNSRSTSPNGDDEFHPPELLSQCISILHSVISEDCRYQTSSPRLLRPPNALQALSLDVTQLLVHMHNDSPKLLGEIASAILPAFVTFRSEMHPRLLRFFEEGVLRSMLDQTRQIQGINDIPSDEKRDGFLNNGLDHVPPIVSIQVEEAQDDSVLLSQSGANWRRWTSPISSAAGPVSSTNAPGQAISLYHLTSIISPLLAAISGAVDLTSAPLSTLHRFYRLFQMIVDLKPDTYLDLLEVVAYDTPRARRTSLSLLTSFWPRAIGHAVVTKPLPILTYGEAVSEAGTRTRHPVDHPYAHQFVPWRFFASSKPALFDGISYRDCRSCMQPVSDFGLLCPYCTCAVHFDCYDYPEGCSSTEYAMDSDPNTQKVAMHRFCHVLPARRTSNSEALQAQTHIFRLVNLFTLSLCFVCRQPLWGSIMQALKCDSCGQFAHAYCVPQISVKGLPDCGSSPITSAHMSISWSALKRSFVDHYRDFILSDVELSMQSFEELSVSSDALWIQSRILDNGTALGSIVVDDILERELQGIGPKALLDTYENVLSSIRLPISGILDEYLQENSLQASHRSLLYDWPTLGFISSTIKTAHDNLKASPSNSFDLLAAQPFPIDTSDRPTHPYEVLSLGHLRDALGIAFQLHSDSTARLLLSHLHHVGLFDRLDFRSELFVEGSDPVVELCLFPLPLGLDFSADVETLVAAIEASLSDTDLTVNEIGFLLLARRFWPNEMATGYALRRLTGSLLSWIFAESDDIESVLRDFASNRSGLPGVRLGVDIQPWPISHLRSTYTNSEGNGGEYVSYRRVLLNKYAARWMLALHDQDPTFYSQVLHELVTELTEQTDVLDEVNDSDISQIEGQCLQRITRLCQSAVVFTAFDDLFARWLDSSSVIWHLHKPLPALQRLFIYEGDLNGRSSVAIDPTTIVADSSALTGIDLWGVFMRLVTRKDGLLRGLQCLCMFARSAVDIPFNVFQKSASLASNLKLSITDSTPLARAALSSAWLKSRGRQDLIGIIVSLHQRLAREIVASLINRISVAETSRFIRQSLTTFLLLAGCGRQTLIEAGFILDSELDELPSRRKATTRASMMSDPIHIDTEFIAVLGSYVDTDNEDVSCLLAKFFGLFVNECSLLESHEVDNFILRNSTVLSSCIWRFYEAQRHEIAAIRANLLLRVLVVYSQPFESLLERTLQACVSWSLRLQAVKRLFRMILDITSPAFTLEDRQWRSSTVCIFYHYFTSMWRDPQEEVRVAVDTWSQTLLPIHFEAMSRCWNEFLSKAPIPERVRLIAFLIQLHPHFPSWAGKIFFRDIQAFFEHILQSCHGRRSLRLFLKMTLRRGMAIMRMDLPPLIWQSMYGISHRASDDGAKTIDSDMATLRVSIILLSMKMMEAGIPIDLFSLLKLKVHLLRIVGFADVVAVPTASGNMFSVSFRDLGAITTDSWPCLNELLVLLDCSLPFSLPPTAMAGARHSDDSQSTLLIGSIFVDFVLALLLDVKDLLNLPFLTIKCLLESVLIIIYKHDMESAALKHLQGSLRRVVRRSIDISLENVSYELRQLGLTVSQAYIKRWPTFTGSYVLEATEVAARLVINLGYNKEDILVSQALAFIEACISIFGESGLLIALCKRGQSDDVFAVLRLVTDSDARGPSSRNTREILLRDAFSRALETEIDAVKTAMENLQKYVDLVYNQEYSADLMQFIGLSLTTIIRRAAEWTPDMFDPSPLLLIAANLVQNNKAHSRELLIYLDNLLRAILVRFNVTQDSLTRILKVSANIYRMTMKQAPAANGHNPSGNAIRAFLEVLSDGLRRKSRVPPLTISAMTEAAATTFSPGSPEHDIEWRDLFNRLADDAVWYLQTHGTHERYGEAEFNASLSIAKLVLYGTERDPEIIHRAILEQQSEKATRQFLGMRGWNILVLAALNHLTAIPGSVLMSHFSAFVYTYCDSLASPLYGNPDITGVAVTISHAYAAIKLWLLLDRKLAMDEWAAKEVNPNDSALTVMIWNELWPPFQHLISTTWSRVKIRSHVEYKFHQLARALRSLTEPSTDVPWDVLVDQAGNDLLAAEKLLALEAKGRDIGKSNADKRRDSRVVSIS